MLLIFDLDDTLIETTALITPSRLRNALKRMIEGGLKVEAYDTALSMMYRLDSTARSSKHSLSEFIELYAGDDELFEMAKEEVYHAPLLDDICEPSEKVNDILNGLAKDHILAIVTMGDPTIQREKVKRFGIDEELFYDIIVTSEKNKGIHYSRLAERCGYSFSEVVVIGDRVEIDLKDAIALGCISIHIRQGRGANYRGSIENIDYTIYDLSELLDIMKSIQVETI